MPPCPLFLKAQYSLIKNSSAEIFFSPCFNDMANVLCRFSAILSLTYPQCPGGHRTHGGAPHLLLGINILLMGSKYGQARKSVELKEVGRLLVAKRKKKKRGDW